MKLEAFILGLLLTLFPTRHASVLPNLIRATYSESVDDFFDDGKSGWPHLIYGGKTKCPTSDAKWYAEGSEGGIVDSKDGYSGNGTPHTLFHFYPSFLGTGGSTSASQCKAYCDQWPIASNGDSLTATNGEYASCAYWSWNGLNDCYLYSCGVCSSSDSFNPSVMARSQSYISGAGPGAGRCSSGVKGDPHFHGADNSNFDFTGYPNHHYCLVSDSHIHINAFYGGRFDKWGKEANKSLTWIRKIGILWGHHTVELVAREGPTWQYENGYVSRIAVDGEDIRLSQAGDSANFADENIKIAWESAKLREGNDLADVYSVKIGRVLNMRVTVRPEIQMLRTVSDGVIHFDIEFLKLDLSNRAHGVLGQTYRKDFNKLMGQKLEHNKVLNVDVVKGDNAEGFIDGNVVDYESRGILSHDCFFSRFTRASMSEEETARAIEINSVRAISSMEDSFKEAVTI